MLAMLGIRRQELLKLLLRSKGGLSVEELSGRLGITRNAVRQHLAVLEGEGLVVSGDSRPSGGRPEQLYLLTAAGRELFPRHYSWFAQLLVESLRQEAGSEAARQRLGALGAGVARQLLGREGKAGGGQERVEDLAEVMEELGYEARTVQAEGGEPVIEASNCVFHRLALADPDICEFDLTLLATFTGGPVIHEECMATGGHVCRFRFPARNEAPPDRPEGDGSR